MSNSLDISFGTNGIVNDYYITNNYSSIDTVAIDSQKRIVVSGRYSSNSYSSFSLARYLKNGQLDTTFGTGGIATFAGIALNQVSSIMTDALNNIIAVGDNNGSPIKASVVKVLPNGQLDTTFGTGGVILITSFYSSYLYQVKIDNLNNIVICGHSGQVSGGNLYLISRYLPNGQIDTTFGTGGYVSGSFFGLFASTIKSLAFDSLNRIVVGGNYGNSTKSVLARFLTNGSLDTTFGTGGIVINSSIPSSSEIFSVAIDSSNRVIAGGYTSSSYLLLRLLENGQYDTTFGTGGIIINKFPISGTPSLINSIAIDTTNHIVCVGNNNSERSGSIALYTPYGQLDTTFGSGGTIQYSSVSNSFQYVVIDNLNRIVVGGYSKGNPYFLGRILTPYSVTETPEPPPPPTSSTVPASKKSLFTNNSLVFYKPGTFGGGDTGSTTNSRVKSRRC